VLTLQPPVHSFLRSVDLSAIVCAVNRPLLTFTCRVPATGGLDVELRDSVALHVHRSILSPLCVAFPGDDATEWLRVSSTLEISSSSPSFLGININQLQALVGSSVAAASVLTMPLASSPVEAMQLVALLSAPCSSLLDRTQVAHVQFLLGWLRPAAGPHGAVLGNVAVSVLVALLHGALLTLLILHRPDRPRTRGVRAEGLVFPFNRLASNGWFPAPAIALTSFNFVGTSYSSFELIFGSEFSHSGDVAVGALGLIFVCAFLIYSSTVVRFLDRRMLVGAASVAPAPRHGEGLIASVAKHFFTPQTVWRPRRVTACYGLLFASARTRQLAVFLPAQSVLTLLELLALIARVPQWAGFDCSHNFAAAAALFGLHAVSIAALRPFRSHGEVVFGTTMYSLLAAICLANYFSTVGNRSDAARDARLTLQLLLLATIICSTAQRVWIVAHDVREEQRRQRVRQGFRDASSPVGARDAWQGNWAEEEGKTESPEAPVSTQHAPAAAAEDNP
jgi:hypothetical protein